MKNLFKKLLASCLVVCMVLTLCVGAITVNAEAPTATVTAEDVTVKSGEGTADVSITASAGIAATEINVMVPDGLTISKIAVEKDEADFYTQITYASEDGNTVEIEDESTVAPKIVDGAFNYIIHAPANEVTFAPIKVTITFAGTFVENAEGIPVDVEAEAAQDAEVLFNVEVTDAYIFVESAHECVAGEAVKENEVAAGCTTAGSYDLVTYCTGCGEEMNRETFDVEALGHAWDDGVIDPDATCTDEGVKTFTCATCGETKTEAISAKGHTAAAETVKKDEVAATCTTDGSYRNVVVCEVCGAEISSETITVKALGHDYEGSKTYMNKETHTWHKDCVVCGEATDVDANVIEASLISNSLILEAAVGDKIGINRATSSGLVNKYGYSDYYIEVEYEAYGTGYVIENKIKKFTSSDFFSQNGKKTIDYFKFTEVALYEMAKDFTINLYLLDAEGDVAAVNRVTTSIQSLAITFANDYSSDKPLMKCLADMMKYGAAVQEYFADLNPGTAIDGAKLPTEGFDEAFLNGSSTVDELPESFNTTKLPGTLLEGTKAAVGTPSVVIGASNTVKYQIKANKTDGYVAENMTLVASYVDAYGRDITTDEVIFTKLEVADGKNTVYTYIFKDLAIYDLDKTITLTFYNNGIAECNYEYSVGNFIDANISNAKLNDLLTKMQLFSQSAKAKLVG